MQGWQTTFLGMRELPRDSASSCTGSGMPSRCWPRAWLHLCLVADYLEVGYADEQQEQAALAWLVSTTLTAVLPHEGMLPGDLSSLVPEFSSVSFVIAAGRAEPGPLL